jgi:hypothetical protein
MQQNTDTDRPAVLPVEIDHVIAQLAGHQAYLAAHIDRHWDDLEPLQLARTLSLYGQNAARLGRLFHDRPAILGVDYDYDDGPGIPDETFRWLAEEIGYVDPPDADAAAGEEGLPGKDTDTGDDAGSAQASPDIDDVITALAASQDHLSGYLDSHRDELEPRPLERLLSVYSQNATRLGRLLHYRSDIYGPPPDPFRVAMDEGLDLFWEEVNARNAANAADAANAANAYKPLPFGPLTT